MLLTCSLLLLLLHFYWCMAAISGSLLPPSVDMHYYPVYHIAPVLGCVWCVCVPLSGFTHKIWYIQYSMCFLKCCSVAPLVVKNSFYLVILSPQFSIPQTQLWMHVDISTWNDEWSWLQPVVWCVEHRSCYVYVVSRSTHKYTHIHT